MKVNILKNIGLSYPEGFMVSGLSCGIKDSGKKDLGLLYSEEKCNCVGLFTQNIAKAHPVIISKKNLKDNLAQALIVNSGNANCLNGKKGYEDALAIIKRTKESLKIKASDVIIASTGIIGEKLPTDKILGSIPALINKLGKSKVKDEDFTKAIMTTDTKPKFVATRIKVGGKVVKIAAVAKGAGMICPDMATMLAFFTSDIKIKVGDLSSIFKDCIGKTFNAINVDGQASTNDTAVIFTNGLAGNKALNKQELNIFKKALLLLCSRLAEDIIDNAEGSTKVICVNIKNATTLKTAKEVANSVANSILLKTAIYGENPNWGRIIQALGSSSVNLPLDKIKVDANNAVVFKNKTIIKSKNSKRFLRPKKINININLNSGNKAYKITTCDLTKEYIKINSEY